MIPLRLELKNFLAYRSPDPVRFDGIHLACLTGPNGAGKSSLLDAITWALWGRARAKRDEDMIYIGQIDMHVQLDFEQEGTIYRVLRRRSKRHSTLDLFAIIDGQPNVLSEPSMRDTQDKINRLLRLDYETFTHSAFLQQGKADAFTTKPPAQRKQILSDILGLERWTQYEDAVKEQLKSIAAELNVIDLRIAEIQQELTREPQLRAVLVEAEQAQQDAQTALHAAEKKLDEVAHAPSAMKSAQDRLADLERRRREHERDLETIAQDIARQTRRVADFQSIISARADIEAGYQALQSAREVDFSLGDKLRQLSDFDARRRELENQLRDARAELENEASGYAARIGELQRSLDGAQPEALALVQAEVAELQALETQRQTADDQMRRLSEEKAELEGVKKALTAEGQNLRDRLERLKVTQEATCPLCGQPLDANHRQELVEQLEAEVARRRSDYSANQERIKAISDELKVLKSQSSVLDAELKRLPPLIERAGLLQAQINTADEAAARLAEAQARLDAVTALLESDSFGSDIRQQLAHLDSQRAAVGYDSTSHTAARQQLETYRDYDARHQQLEIALTALPDTQAALDAACQRQQRVEQALADDQKAVEQLRAEIAELEVLVREQQVRQQEVNRLRTIWQQQYQRLTIAQQELDALDKQRERQAQLETRREQKCYEEGLYRDLRDAFGKNGVPTMIIEAAIPELEASANRLLARMTDGRMHLTLNTQREKQTGGVTETLEIQIADELGTRSYEMYSGGEAFRINFAIRVALSQLLARRSGAHLRTLFVDEGFGTQDEEGRNRLVEAITAIQEDFDLILVITHMDDLRDSFPVHVIVQKTPNGSRVSVR